MYRVASWWKDYYLCLLCFLYAQNNPDKISLNTTKSFLLEAYAYDAYYLVETYPFWNRRASLSVQYFFMAGIMEQLVSLYTFGYYGFNLILIED